MNKYVVGDIHGNIEALNQVLDKAPIKLGDELIFLGDYGDGFPNTVAVVDKLLKLDKYYECVFLQGNHDYWVQDFLTRGAKPTIWYMQGGKATIDNYVKKGELANKDHLSFWANLQPYHVDINMNLFVHAGWNPLDGSFHTVKNKRKSNNHLEITWNRVLASYAIDKPQMYGDLDRQIKENLNDFNNIFIGHTATHSHKPEIYNHVYLIDTGAGWDGRLTIMDVDSKEYWQSDRNKANGRSY